ncbi:hypothetical protein [Streptomyces rubiginosohelvolus]|uniref:hypothetical protein n=1 Tax=Streptomyces rubiginosohelvolus TaxID=67362 RepID=UPI0035D5C25C
MPLTDVTNAEDEPIQRCPLPKSGVITAVNYRLPSQCSSDLQEIALSATHRFIEHAPARES